MKNTGFQSYKKYVSVGLLYLTTKAWRLKLIMNQQLEKHFCGTLWCIVRVGSDNEG